MKFMFEKNCLASENLIDSPVYPPPGSQLRIRITTRILDKLETFLGIPIGTRRSFLMKTTGDEKSRDTVPLNIWKEISIL
jgi:hypothetical protein